MRIWTVLNFGTAHTPPYAERTRFPHCHRDLYTRPPVMVWGFKLLTWPTCTKCCTLRSGPVTVTTIVITARQYSDPSGDHEWTEIDLHNRIGSSDMEPTRAR